ncbi:MAG: hemagglutinin repeat-containing protein, partial [Alcanivoracaceae bacterium]|nr:hemagglutinin repeat-containing protein [Alcanivoracaceae bacterium]
FASYKETSVGSNLSASNITIKSGGATTLQGSQLEANNTTIDSAELNILASKDVNTSSDSSEHKNMNVSMGIYGGDATSGSVSADNSQSNNQNVTHTNAGISGGNITINTTGKTTVAGGNIHASNTLNLSTGSLDVSSVQDSTSSKSSSQGMSASSGGSGSVNGAISRSSSKETVLTSITGGTVNIDVAGTTTVTGATIAAVDADGNDNGQLSLKTDTLTVSSLNNTTDSKSTSMSVSAGGTASVDASADNSHSKTKTLATLGSGSINVAHEANSDTTMLNRDINDNEVDIYAIESHKGIKGSLDTNLLTEQGRDKIAEDIMKSGMIVDTVRQIVMDDTVGITEFFSETDKQHKTYEAVKEKIATDPALAAKLQDPNLNPQEKEAMLNGITDAVMVKLGYTTHENVIVANANDPRAGHISAESGTTTAYINDANAYVDSTGKLVIAAGHEASHTIDTQSDENYVEGTREDYATNYGENLTNFTDMALDINGYDNGMATSNSHTGNRSEYVTNNTAAYNQLDKAKGDDFIQLIPLIYTMATGALVGAGVDVVVQGASNAVEGKPIDDIDGKKVLVSGAMGAVGGGIATAAKAFTQAGSVVIQQGAELLADATTSVVTKKAKGEEVTVKGVLYDVGAGQLGGAIGSKLAKKNVLSSSTYDDLTSQAERASRMASSTKANGSTRKIGRPVAKQKKAAKANAVVESFVDGNAMRGGIVGSGAAGGSLGVIKVNSENKEKSK